MNETKLSTLKYLVVLPPPLTGMTKISAEMLNMLKTSHRLIGKSISKKNNAILPWSIYKHFFLILNAIKLCLTKPTRAPLYMVLDSGNGLWGSVMIGVIAKLTRTRLIVHHHVFSYFHDSTIASKIFFKLAGKSALHIVLCNAMSNKLKTIYGAGYKTFVLSNKVFIMEEAVERKNINRNNPDSLTIGFLSNITLEKGIQDFIATINHIPNHTNNIKSIIAGPASETAVINEIEQFIKADPTNRSWVGPVYDDKKLAFFKEIDILLFPTRYKNEAEPLVIYEALTNGVIVLSNDRGCIAEQISKEFICPDPDIFYKWATKIIVEYLQDRTSLDFAPFHDSNKETKSLTFNNLKCAIHDEAYSQ